MHIGCIFNLLLLNKTVKKKQQTTGCKLKEKTTNQVNLSFLNTHSSTLFQYNFNIICINVTKTNQMVTLDVLKVFTIGFFRCAITYASKEVEKRISY